MIRRFTAYICNNKFLCMFVQEVDPECRIFGELCGTGAAKPLCSPTPLRLCRYLTCGCCMRNRHSDGDTESEAAPAAHVRALHAHGHRHTLLTPHCHRHCTGHSCIRHTHTHSLPLSLSPRPASPPTHRHCVCRIS